MDNCIIDMIAWGKCWECIFFVVTSIVLHNFVYIQLWVQCEYQQQHTGSLCHGVIFRSIFRVMRLIGARRLISKYLFLSYHDEVLCHHRCCFHLFIHSFIIFDFCLYLTCIEFCKPCMSMSVYIARINGMMIYQRDCQFSHNTY